MVSYTPKTLKEALEIRKSHDVIPYAGGTDLMVQNPKDASYLFISKLDELRQIKEDERYIRIGAAVTFSEAIAHPLVPEMMKKAVKNIASPAIRNAGTFGGNIGNASDKADSVVVMFSMDARLKLVSLSGEREVDIVDFYRGRKELDLRKDELIAEVLLPKENTKNYYYENVGGREALAISHVALSGVYRIENGCIRFFSAAFIADTPVVLRFRDIEEKIEGSSVDELKAKKDEILGAFDAHIKLNAFGRVSGEYRKTVCMNLVKDYLENIIGSSDS